MRQHCVSCLHFSPIPIPSYLPLFHHCCKGFSVVKVIAAPLNYADYSHARNPSSRLTPWPDYSPAVLRSPNHPEHIQTKTEREHLWNYDWDKGRYCFAWLVLNFSLWARFTPRERSVAFEKLCCMETPEHLTSREDILDKLTRRNKLHARELLCGKEQQWKHSHNTTTTNGIAGQGGKLCMVANYQTPLRHGRWLWNNGLKN
jgi:hypothetical protein